MLRNFIVENRNEILDRARARVMRRGVRIAAGPELPHGLPIFLEQLGEALRRSAQHEGVDHAEIQNSATHHGEDLFEQGLTVAQVVNSYGDLCQVITGLAVDKHTVVDAGDFRTLNLCLDDATAGAVTAFVTKRERAITDEGTERLGVLAHEMRNALNTATLALGSIKSGEVAISSSTGAILDRSLVRLQTLVDGSLAEVRVDAGLTAIERIPLWEIIEEAQLGGSIVARGRGILLVVPSVEHSIVVEADRPILAAALANIVQNAFKFTKRGGTVTLRVRTTAARVLIEVEDECGGLPAGEAEALLRPFVQRGQDRTGVGLGLYISMKGVKMMAGEIHIRDLVGKGCVFTIDLPRPSAD
ncbi:MAG: HAMP domain-containing sensor histidine kinase [Polyangiaceae bacterium]